MADVSGLAVYPVDKPVDCTGFARLGRSLAPRTGFELVHVCNLNLNIPVGHIDPVFVTAIVLHYHNHHYFG